MCVINGSNEMHNKWKPLLFDRLVWLWKLRTEILFPEQEQKIGFFCFIQIFDYLMDEP